MKTTRVLAALGCSFLLGWSAMADANAPATATSSTASPASSASRRLRANDAVYVTVYQEEDLATRASIDDNGNVMLPLLGLVKVSGMTAGEAADKIRGLYDKDYLVNPQVNLIIEKFAQITFSVLGQVQRPGNFDFPQNQNVNLLEAIAMAGGYTRLGNPSKVDVKRQENGTQKVYHLDAKQMTKDTVNKPFEILPDDIISVGESTF